MCVPNDGPNGRKDKTMERNVIIKNFGGETFVYGFVEDVESWLIDELLNIGLNYFIPTADERDELLKYYTELYKAVHRFGKGQFILLNFLELGKYGVRPMTELDT